MSCYCNTPKILESEAKKEMSKLFENLHKIFLLQVCGSPDSSRTPGLWVWLHHGLTYLGSCGGPDWPTRRISAAKPRALAYSRRPDTALLFRWLMRSPTPASWAARNSSAVSGGKLGHVAPEKLSSLPLEGPRGNWGWRRQMGEAVMQKKDVNSKEKSFVTDVTKIISLCPRNQLSL